jgi:hypothetical protein
VVEFKEGFYLYAGLLDGYEVNEDGQLDRILLIQAQRRKLANDRQYDKDVDDNTRFYPIAGDAFVLCYNKIKTLNLTYVSLGDETPDSDDESPSQ